MNWKVKLERRVRITQKSRYRFNNKKLSKIYITTKALFLLNKNKGWGIVILDRKHYIEKCLSIVESKHFKKLKV